MLNEKINEWAINNKHDFWGQNAIVEIYAYYKEYINTGKYPYLRQVCEFIQQHEQITDSKTLETQVYLASKQYQREQTEIHRINMINTGWMELNKDIAKTLNGLKIKVSATCSGAIFDWKVDNIFKVLVSSDGCSYLMKPRATRKGIAVVNLDNAFYKLV